MMRASGIYATATRGKRATRLAIGTRRSVQRATNKLCFSELGRKLCSSRVTSACRKTFECIRSGAVRQTSQMPQPSGCTKGRTEASSALPRRTHRESVLLEQKLFKATVERAPRRGCQLVVCHRVHVLDGLVSELMWCFHYWPAVEPEALLQQLQPLAQRARAAAYTEVTWAQQAGTWRQCRQAADARKICPPA